MRGGWETEDVERRAGFPVDEVGVDAVIEDPVVIVYAGPVVEHIRHGIIIEIEMQMGLPQQADCEELRRERDRHGAHRNRRILRRTHDRDGRLITRLNDD